MLVVEFDWLIGVKSVYSGKYSSGVWFLPTPKSAGEMLRYFLTCAFDTHWYVGKVRCKATKSRWAVGLSKKPLAEAR